MISKEIQDRLNDIKFEDFVWIIYIIVIIFSFIANKLEADYLKTGNVKSKSNYRKIMIGIFTVLVIIYLSFFKDSYDDLKSLNDNDSEQKKNLTFLSFLASLFIVISGFLYLYILIKDEDIDVEIAFN